MRGVGAFPLLLLILRSTMCASAACTTRRCLAQALIGRALLSQPQTDTNCTQPLKVPFIEYQTLSVDTLNLRFTSKLKAWMIWTDPEMAWNRSEYDYEKVVLPVDKVWTPELRVTNSMSLEVLHGSKDLLAYSDGNMTHTLSFIVVVDCEVNLFKYPFSSDMCPVAIEAWSKDGCGMDLQLRDVYLLDGEQGDWSTDSVTLEKRGAGQHFILVSLSTKSSSPFISLILPSILILFVDVVSFALPLGGGERNSFKVTLALSFIMFLLILNSLLPGDSQCSPILRAHFCVCLVFLVLSMTASMLLTRVAKDGLMIPLTCRKNTTSTTSKPGEDPDEEESAGGGGGDDDPGNELTESSRGRLQLQKVVDFLEGLEEKKRQDDQFYRTACRLDEVCFCLYVLMCLVYFCVLAYMFTSYTCDIDHFKFWY